MRIGHIPRPPPGLGQPEGNFVVFEIEKMRSSNRRWPRNRPTGTHRRCRRDRGRSNPLAAGASPAIAAPAPNHLSARRIAASRRFSRRRHDTRRRRDSSSGGRLPHRAPLAGSAQLGVEQDLQRRRPPRPAHIAPAPSLDLSASAITRASSCDPGDVSVGSRLSLSTRSPGGSLRARLEAGRRHAGAVVGEDHTLAWLGTVSLRIGFRHSLPRRSDEPRPGITTSSDAVWWPLLRAAPSAFSRSAAQRQDLAYLKGRACLWAAGVERAPAPAAAQVDRLVAVWALYIRSRTGRPSIRARSNVVRLPRTVRGTLRLSVAVIGRLVPAVAADARSSPAFPNPRHLQGGAAAVCSHNVGEIGGSRSTAACVRVVRLSTMFLFWFVCFLTIQVVR